MCINLVTGGKSKNTKRTSRRFEDIYLKLTVKLFDFIHRRTKCHFSKGKEDKVAVLVRTVIDNVRVGEVAALKVIILKFTERAWARIEKVGGECLSFNQLALRAPHGQNTLLNDS